MRLVKTIASTAKRLLQLPRAQLVDAIGQQESIKDQLISYAATNFSSVPTEALEVLGLAEEDD